MKKYDIAILALYLMLIGTIYGTVRYVYLKEQDLRKIFVQVVNNQDVTSVIVDNVESDMEIFYGTEEDNKNWRLRGSINQTHLDKIYIENGALHIKDIEEGRLRILRVKRNTPITITNSPKVKILSDKELAERIENERTKRLYEF